MIKLEMARNRVTERLGEEPVLSSSPTEETPGGCDYYAMRDRPLANVWTFCFNERDRVSLGVTQYSPQQPAPPEGASPARQVLLARGDSICQSEYGELDEITKDVSRALRALDRDDTQRNRETTGKAISKFVANLEETHSMLSAFEAPSDELDTLESYLDALGSQAEVLDRAREALLAGDDTAYETLGEELNALARTAKEQARSYGFATCSAPTFG